MSSEDLELMRKFSIEWSSDVTLAELHYHRLQHSEQTLTPVQEELGNSLPYAFWTLAWEINLQRLSEGSATEAITTVERITRGEGEQEFDRMRYIRELLQNAMDVRIPEKQSEWRIELQEGGGLEFRHDGRPFMGLTPSGGGEARALFKPGATTKSFDFSTVGQFGIGFKGWILFYKSVQVTCDDGKHRCTISWGPTRTGRFGLHALHIGESTDSLETVFEFSEPRNDIGEWDSTIIGGITDEVMQMVNIRHDGIIVDVSNGDSVVRVENEIQIEREQVSEGTPSTWQYRCRTTVQTGDETTEQINHVVETELMPYEEIDEAIGVWIGRESSAYEIMGDDNPFAGIEAKHWYCPPGGKTNSIRFCISLQDDFRPRPWLSNLVPIEYGIGLSADSLTTDECRWLIDGPFFLNPDRLMLHSDERSRRANINMLRQAMKRCFPVMYQALERDPENADEGQFIEWLLDQPTGLDIEGRTMHRLLHSGYPGRGEGES